MATTIKFEYDGRNYVLGYSRRAVQQMSDSGFTLDKFADDAVGYHKALFTGAFIQYHRNTQRSVIDDIWDNLPNKEELLKVLVEMYSETTSTMFADPKDEAKKVEWEVAR